MYDTKSTVMDLYSTARNSKTPGAIDSTGHPTDLVPVQERAQTSSPKLLADQESAAPDAESHGTDSSFSLQTDNAPRKEETEPVMSDKSVSSKPSLNDPTSASQDAEAPDETKCEPSPIIDPLEVQRLREAKKVSDDLEKTDRKKRVNKAIQVATRNKTEELAQQLAKKARSKINKKTETNLIFPDKTVQSVYAEGHTRSRILLSSWAFFDENGIYIANARINGILLKHAPNVLASASRPCPPKHQVRVYAFPLVEDTLICIFAHCIDGVRFHFEKFFVIRELELTELDDDSYLEELRWKQSQEEEGY